MSNEFSSAEDLRPVITALIAKKKDTRFSHLQANMFVLRRRFGERAVKWIARVSLVPKRFKDMFPEGAEFILEVDADQFDTLDSVQKEAVLFHELMHTHRNEKGKYCLVQHDIMEFNAVIEEYGGYLGDVVRTINAVNRRLEAEKGNPVKLDTAEEIADDLELEEV